MTTQAQVLANRLNAQKSTGPRTAEGKAAAAQNAVKHGLAGRLDVIKGEDQAEFDRHRQALLAELAPAGAMESMLAERIVRLSWRLQRVERMQEEAFDALLTPDTSNPLVRLTQSLLHKKPADESGDGEGAGELTLGRMAVKDFSYHRVLDRLLMYERRMEHSLYRTLAELHRLRLLRNLDGPTDEPARSGLGTVGAGLKPAPTASKETPAGVTTNEPATPEQSCKTKPICRPGSKVGVLG